MMSGLGSVAEILWPFSHEKVWLISAAASHPSALQAGREGNTEAAFTGTETCASAL